MGNYALDSNETQKQNLTPVVQYGPMSKDQLSQQLLIVAKTAAFRAGEMLIEAFAGNKPTSEKSSRHDLVTEYDHRAERIIIDQIMGQYPDSTILGEEGGSQGSGAVQWFVDPIDGTTNFALGIPFFNVSIAAALEGEILAGVVYDPMRQELFAASRQGAFLNDRPIRARRGVTEAEAVLVTDWPYPDYRFTDDDFLIYAEVVRRFRAVRRMGSLALEMCYVACGRVDVCFSLLGKAWDVAAAMLLLEQVGARYRPIPGLNKGTWPPSKFIASGPDFELEQSSLKFLLRQPLTGDGL